jgi:FkbM family methyltransferase
MATQDSPKAVVTGLLARAGLYERLKASLLYDAYWMVVDSRIITGRTREVDFYRKTLDGFQPGQVIFDIGANQGYKVDIFLRLGAKVIAVDPDEANQAKLRQKFHSLRLSSKPVQVVGKAVSDSHTMATMYVDAPGSAKNTLNQKWVDTLRTDDARFGHTLGFESTRTVETTTVEELIDAYGMPFFIKIDVEGHEPAVLRGLKRPVPYISLEVNLPEFLAEGLECVDLLHGLAANGQFNYATDLKAGLVLPTWQTYQEFRRTFEQVRDESIEVFWRTRAS